MTVVRILLFMAVAGVVVMRFWGADESSANSSPITNQVAAHAVHVESTSGDGAVASGAVVISPTQQRLIGLRTVAVEAAPHKRVIRALGRVAADETKIYKLNAGADGFIREVSDVTTGAMARKGQWLGDFSTTEAYAPIQAYLVTLDVLDRAAENGADAPAQNAAAEASSAQALDRLLNLGLSRRQIDEIKQTRRSASTFKIFSPVDGLVLARDLSPGQKFQRGTEWFRIAALDKMWVFAEVFEDDARYIRPGAVARVSPPRRDEFRSARISGAPLRFDPESRRFKVRLEMDNPNFALRPDMLVDVELPIETAPSLSVPIDAVVDSGLRRTVYVERGEGVY